MTRPRKNPAQAGFIPRSPALEAGAKHKATGGSYRDVPLSRRAPNTRPPMVHTEISRSPGGRLTQGHRWFIPRCPALQAGAEHKTTDGSYRDVPLSRRAPNTRPPMVHTEISRSPGGRLTQGHRWFIPRCPALQAGAEHKTTDGSYRDVPLSRRAPNTRPPMVHTEMSRSPGGRRTQGHRWFIPRCPALQAGA